MVLVLSQEILRPSLVQLSCSCCRLNLSLAGVLAMMARSFISRLKRLGLSDDPWGVPWVKGIRRLEWWPWCRTFALDALGRQAGEDGVALDCLEGFFQVHEGGVCLDGSEWLGAVYPDGEFGN